MKEAAGEANLTVIAIILIGVVAAVMTPLVNSYLRTAAQKSCCTNAGGVWKDNKCMNVTSTGAVSGTMTGYWDVNTRTCTDSSTG
ncbi:MAG: hypothetical protein RSB77_01575 [Bacilli bacterium]